MRGVVAIATIGLTALLALPAGAQQQGAVPQAPQQAPQPGVQIQAKPAQPVERETRVVPPPLRYETTRPTDADIYPTGPSRVQHDPAFIEPLATKYETPTSSGRVGLSGWTAPNAPIGSPVSGWRDVSGWFALGFSVTWDGPPAARKPRPPQ
jgi:hypothetical protein